MARKGYPAEFRRRALDLVAAGKTVAEVARLLEVSDQSIYGWRRQELIDRGELPGFRSMMSSADAVSWASSGFPSTRVTQMSG
jgi:transposase-like protein